MKLNIQSKKFNRYFERGFTLMELLIVMAIIGILASIVLVLLTGAREKGQDSSIKTQMLSLRSQAEIYGVNNGGSYDGLFTGNNTWASETDPSVQAILTGINGQTTVHTAGSSSGAWAAQAQFKEDTSQYLCVDSTIAAEEGTDPLLAGDTVCP